jgi:hypothetical protein
MVVEQKPISRWRVRNGVRRHCVYVIRCGDLLCIDPIFSRCILARRARSRSRRAGRGEMQNRSRDALTRPSFANHQATTKFAALENKSKGGGAPISASIHWPRHTIRCYHLNVSGRGSAPQPTRLREPSAAGALAFRRSAAALAGTVTSRLSFGPCLPGRGRGRRTAASSSRYSGSTPRPGRSAGGNDARSRPGAVCETARGHRTRPTFRIASRKRPSMSEIR